MTMNVDSHLTHEQLQAYREQRLPEAELRAASDHIARCAQCRERTSVADAEIVASYERLQGALLGGSHLENSDFAMYADRTASREVRERIEAHARHCDDCAGEIAAYQDLRRQIDDASPPIVASNARPPLRERVSRLFTGSIWRFG